MVKRGNAGDLSDRHQAACRLQKKRTPMSLNRREFLKRTGAGAALLAAGSGMLKSSAFAMNPVKFQATSDVSFVGSSSSGSRRQMIADVLEPWRATVAAGITGKSILIKPNLVFTGALAATHVDAIRGLLDFLRTITSAPIIIGECSTYSPISTLYTNNGYNALTTEYTGVSLMDLNNTGSMPSVSRHIWNTDFTTTTAIAVTSAFFNPDYYVIDICRPKTHNCMVMTGVNKNMLMAAPLTSIKQQMHGAIGWYTGQHTDEDKCLAWNIYQLGNLMYTGGTPALAVLDAWEGMEGEGPVSGTSVMQYCAVASIDPLAVDRLCAKLMGFSDTAIDPPDKATPSYTDPRVLVWLSNAGYGNYDLSRINFILGSLSSLETYVKSYVLNRNYTGTPSYETLWQGSSSPPSTILDSETGVKGSHYLDPKPFLTPQARETISGSRVTVNFSLPIGFPVRLGVFSLKGAVVRRLGGEYLIAGRYTRGWDCRDEHGSRVPAGRYIIKLEFGSRSMCDLISLAR
jgi:uncharacterized protein (DUF362 family)